MRLSFNGGLSPLKTTEKPTVEVERRTTAYLLI